MANKPKDCPLYQHRNGQWAKKIKGKTHYFGKELEPALRKWVAEKDYLLAGITPPARLSSPEAATLPELGNLFIDRCKRRHAAGEIDERSVQEYEKSIRRMIDILGENCQPDNLRPLDYSRLKETLANPVKRPKDKPGKSVDRRSAVTVANDIRRLRVFLKWCSSSELISSPRYGDEFSPISQKQRRRERAKSGRRDLSATDIRAILAKCQAHFKPLVLLGINGGLGNLDLSLLTLADLPATWGQQAEQWLDIARNKTGTHRRILLWPETVNAIENYLAKRDLTAAIDPAERRLFVTRRRQPWVTPGEKDSIGSAFLKTRKKAGVDRGAFYDLRRTFQTVAEGSGDFPAVKFVMGHTAQSSDMSAVYRQAVSDDRIRAVVNHVREWLFGDQ